jgi:hypothetical protein
MVVVVFKARSHQAILQRQVPWGCHNWYTITTECGSFWIKPVMKPPASPFLEAEHPACSVKREASTRLQLECPSYFILLLDNSQNAKTAHLAFQLLASSSTSRARTQTQMPPDEGESFAELLYSRRMSTDKKSPGWGSVAFDTAGRRLLVL